MAEDLRQQTATSQRRHDRASDPDGRPALRVVLADDKLRDAVSTVAASSDQAWRIVDGETRADAAVADLAEADAIRELRQQGAVVVAVPGGPAGRTREAVELRGDDGVDVAADPEEIVMRLGRLRRTARLAAALTAAEAELVEVEGHLQRLTYSVSHDLKEPLRAITGFSRLLETRHSESLDEQALAYLAFVSDGANRLEVMLGALLQFSRLGRQEITLRPVDVSSLVHRAMRDLEAPGGVIAVDGPPPDLVTDQSMLSVVIVALLDNAVKFSAPASAPSVTVRGGVEGDEWWLSVHDNGPGFASTDPTRVFNMFSRLHTRDQFPGIGAGLALAELAATRLGGGLTYALDDEGTTFTLRLPAVDVDDHEVDTTG